VLNFTWDPAKAASNAKKHGVTFPEAATAFGDPLSLTVPDPNHSKGEARFLLMGLTSESRLVVVAHLEGQDSVHIISARLATRTERRDYEEDTSR
jgi:uncharacterized DUF497 family protein